MPNKAKTPTFADVEASIINPNQKGNESMGNSISIMEKSQLTMSSREIAELTGKEHRNVKRDIKNMFEQLEISALNFEHTYLDVQNKRQSEYLLPKKYIECLLTGYSIPLRMKVIDRMYQLEEKVNSNMVILPNFNNPVEAPRAWANEKEKTVLLTHKVEELEPKAVFHDKVTSTKDAISLSQAAKTLGTSRTRLCKFLRENKWLRRNNEPYQEKIEQGLLDVKLSNWEHPDNGLQQSVTALITGKGLSKISQMLSVH